MKFAGKTSPRIRPDRSGTVKRTWRAWALLALLGIALSANSGWGQETPVSRVLPDIEARSFDVRAIRKSRNNRVILFETAKEALPPAGRLILLKKDGQAFVALRVLQPYSDLDTFAAKIVRHYDPQATIAPTDSFNAIEKISDVVPPPPTAQDRADLKELESVPAESVTAQPPPPLETPATPTEPEIPSPGPEQAPAPEDSFLTPEPAPSETPTTTEDSTASSQPPTEPAASQNEEELLSDEEEEMLGQVVEELPVLDPFRHWVSGGFGLMLNGNSYFAGGGARYGYTISKTPFIKRMKIQDSLVVEGGFFFYKVLNISVQNDAYNVVPITGTLRYNVMIGQNMGLFLYTGLVRNFATPTSSVSTDVMANRLSGLSDEGDGLGLLPAFGAGLTFRVGPQWDTRFDIGYDIVSMSLMLRF